MSAGGRLGWRWPRRRAVLAAMAGAALVSVSLLSVAARAQGVGEPGARDTAASPPDSIRMKADTVAVPGRVQKSTTTALILSGLLPGAGQFYNESYWKVPVFLGLGGYFAYEFFYALNKYNEYSNLYDLSVQAPSGGNERFRSLRDFYRQERDRFGWYFLILYIANLVDAYVDATLSDFEIDETLSLRVTPLVRGPGMIMPESSGPAGLGPAAPGVGLGLRLRF